MNVLGMDIGYSNLKIAYGDSSGQPVLSNRPAGAAPSEQIGQRVMGEDDSIRDSSMSFFMSSAGCIC